MARCAKVHLLDKFEKKINVQCVLVAETSTHTKSKDLRHQVPCNFRPEQLKHAQDSFVAGIMAMPKSSSRRKG